jgi:hypothetical protein
VYRGQRDGENGAFARFAAKADAALMSFDHRFHEYQTQSDAVVAPLIGHVDAMKTPEQLGLIGIGNAVAMIANAANDPGWRLVGRLMVR